MSSQWLVTITPFTSADEQILRQKHDENALEHAIIQNTATDAFTQALCYLKFYHQTELAQICAWFPTADVKQKAITTANESEKLMMRVAKYLRFVSVGSDNAARDGENCAEHIYDTGESELSAVSAMFRVTKKELQPDVFWYTCPLSQQGRVYEKLLKAFGAESQMTAEWPTFGDYSGERVVFVQANALLNVKRLAALCESQQGSLQIVGEMMPEVYLDQYGAVGERVLEALTEAIGVGTVQARA